MGTLEKKASRRRNATKRVQVNIDEKTVDSFDFVTSKLGITRTAAINNFMTRVAATGSIPYDNQLTESEMIDKELMEAIDLIPSRKVQKMSDLSDWLAEDD